MKPVRQASPFSHRSCPVLSIIASFGWIWLSGILFYQVYRAEHLGPSGAGSSSRRSLIQRNLARHGAQHAPPLGPLAAAAHRKPEKQQAQQLGRSHAQQLGQQLGAPSLLGTSDTYQVVRVCDDSCSLSRNGRCNDGRGGNISRPGLDRVHAWNYVGCDLGRDCHDCGPAYLRLPSGGAPQAARPIEYLSLQGVRVRLRSTDTQPPLLFAYTDPEADQGLSLQLSTLLGYEPGQTRVVHTLLAGDACVGPAGRRRLVLDVGAGLGWYSLLAAASGCRVVSWEPVPLRSAFLQYSLQANNVSHLVQLRTRLATAQQQQQLFRLSWRGDQRWGEVAVEQINRATADSLEASKAGSMADGSGTAIAAGEQLDDVLLGPIPGSSAGSAAAAAAEVQDAAGSGGASTRRRQRALTAASEWALSELSGARRAARRRTHAIRQEHGLQPTQQQPGLQRMQAEHAPPDAGIALLKVSADGAEPEVLAGAARLLASGAVENILLDYNIGHAERAANWTRYGAYVDMLLALSSAGYRLAHLPEAFSLARVADWGVPLPAFEAVSRDNLMFDKRDARLLEERQLGYPLEPYLAEHYIGWDYGNSIPEDLHPKSLHASFSSSTTVWGALRGSDSEARVMRTGRRVGVLEWDAPLESFLGNGSYGLGRKPCREVPPGQQIKLRCPCSNASVCGRLQRDVLERAGMKMMSEFMVPL